jgi:hypothetical protein
MMHPLHQITQQINTPAADIRAEVLLAQLLENGLSPADASIRQQGQARRPVRADVDEARIERAADDKEQLAVYLNRDGIYDTLPEGMFHQPAAGGKPLAAAGMIDAYRLHKQEEQEARLFFAPLEQEFFLQRTLTEQHLQRSIEHIQHAVPDNELLELLGIDPQLPVYFRATLLRLISHIPVIAGNLPLMEKVFALLLDQPVEIRQRLYTHATGHHLDLPLGAATLGNDMLLGNAVSEVLQRYQLLVGPVSAERLLYFFPGNMGARCIQTLIGFFIPVSWALEVKITAVPAGNDGFILGPGQAHTGRLGYNIVLGKTKDTING